MSSLPAWLDQHVRTITGRPAGSRWARLSRCHHCRAQILTGLDNDIAAFDARADPTPTNEIGEALARLDGRYTYSLTRTKDRYKLIRRDRWQILGDSTHVDILAEHKCHAPLLPGVLSVFQPVQERPIDDDAPPF